MNHKYVILNRYGRPIGISKSISDISRGLIIPTTNVHNALTTCKPLAGKYLILPREKHEYLWHKHGGLKGGDDYFAFCTKEELNWYKTNEDKAI